MPVSSILDASGNPYRAPRDPLTPEARARASDVYRDLPITPLEIDWSVNAIRAALTEHALGLFQRSALLIDAIIGDDRVQCALGARIGALLGLEEVYEQAEADTDGACLAAWKEAWPKCYAPIEQGDVTAEIKRTAHMGGLSISEILWDTSKPVWQPYLKPWHLQHFYYDMGRRTLVALTEDGAVDVTPGDGRWFVHAPAGIWRGWINGLVRPLALPWLLRCLARRDWARYSERHGQPMIKAMVPAIAEASDKERFESDLVTMGTEAVVVLPQGLDGEGFDVSLLEASAQTWEGFDRLIVRCESSITLCVQWQNLTTEVKEGSNAAARVHGDVKQTAIVLDDRTWANDVRDQIARPFAAWNFGNPEKAARARRDVEVLEDRVADTANLESFSRALASLRQAGDPIDVESLAKAYRVKLPMGTARTTEPTIYGYHLTAGIVRRNEARARLGLPPVEGPEGDAFLGATDTSGGDAP